MFFVYLYFIFKVIFVFMNESFKKKVIYFPKINNWIVLREKDDDEREREMT